MNNISVDGTDGDRIEVGGSLGGVQVVSLSERAGVHSRVLAAGRAPAAPHPHYPHHSHHAHHPPRAPDHSTSEEKALLFTVSRTIRPARPEDSKGEHRFILLLMRETDFLLPMFVTNYSHCPRFWHCCICHVHRTAF